MSDNMPTTEQVRDAVRPYRVHPKEFDRWLAAHDKQVAAQALREAAADIRACYLVGVHAPTVERYLTGRARNIGQSWH